MMFSGISHTSTASSPTITNATGQGRVSSPAAAAAAVTSSSSAASPPTNTTTTRSSRLRGLSSALRHHHHHQNNSGNSGNHSDQAADSTSSSSRKRSAKPQRTNTSTSLGDAGQPSSSSQDQTARASSVRRRSTSAPNHRNTAAADSPDVLASEGMAEASQNGTSATAATTTNGGERRGPPHIRFLPHNENLRGRPSLDFRPISRTLPSERSIIRVGRYSERDSATDPAPSHPSDAPVGFKSKVVSRRHCEFFYEDHQWYIKDVKSSSGTFLNHIRLSQPGIESRPFPIKDGDIVQLGIDFKGGEEMIFRCVKIKVECNREVQRLLNKFNKSTHKHLRQLAIKAKQDPENGNDASSKHSTECTICLNSIAPCQALFVAPCSHTWHYKCIRNLLDGREYPYFTCPNCRARHDLEDDIEDLGEDFDYESESEFVDADAAMADLSLNDTNRNTHDSSGATPADPEATTSVSLAPPSGQTNGHVPAADASSSSASVPIPQRKPSTQPEDPGAAISPNVEPLEGVGPMTPRNTAGPFVFDGGARTPEDDGLEASLDSEHGPIAMASLDGAASK